MAQTSESAPTESQPGDAKVYTDAEKTALFDKLERRFGPDAVLFDTETTSCDPATLILTTAVAISVRTRQVHVIRTWGRGDDAEGEIGMLAALLDSASVIMVHNKGFDIDTVMAVYFDAARVAAWERKTLDLFEVILQHESSWRGVNDLCLIEGLTTKTSDGKGAVVMWEEGRYEELWRYCAVDVIMLLELFALDKVHFCCTRWFQGKQKHIGYGVIDLDTMTVAVTYGNAAPPPMAAGGPCPCVTMRGA